MCVVCGVPCEIQILYQLSDTCQMASLKNEDDLENEDNLKNDGNLKNEDNLILKTVPGPS